jgi:hypothetical protein
MTPTAADEILSPDNRNLGVLARLEGAWLVRLESPQDRSMDGHGDRLLKVEHVSRGFRESRRARRAPVEREPSHALFGRMRARPDQAASDSVTA